MNPPGQHAVAAIPRWTVWVAVSVIAVLAPLLLIRAAADRDIGPSERTTAIQVATAALATNITGGPSTGIRVSWVDDGLLRVTFWDGARLLGEAAVTPDGGLVATKQLIPGPRYGWSLSDQPLVLLFFAGLFVMATMRSPLVCLTNLDVGVCATTAVLVVLDDRLLTPIGSTLAATGMLYLIARSLAVALGPATAHARTRLVARAVLERSGRSPTRLAAFGAIATGLVGVLIVLGSNNVIDVGFASAAGATLLREGTLPYGHMPPEVIHGDTYPFLNYVLYLPGALFAPVHDMFGDLRPTLVVAVLALVAMVAGVVVAARHARGADGFNAWRLGLAAAAFPTLAVTGSSGSNDMVIGAITAWLIALAARPAASSALLAAGAWVKLGPLALVPLWLARLRGRALLRSLTAMTAISGGLVAWILVLDRDGVRKMVRAIAFQFQRRSMQSLWGYWDIAWAQALAQAVALGAITLVVLAVAANPARLDSPRRVAGAIGAVLLLVQFCASYWVFLYIAWIVPCLVIGLFGEADGAEPRSTSA